MLLHGCQTQQLNPLFWISISKDTFRSNKKTAIALHRLHRWIPDAIWNNVGGKLFGLNAEQQMDIEEQDDIQWQLHGLRTECSAPEPVPASRIFSQVELRSNLHH